MGIKQPQNQTVLRLGFITHPGDERGLLKCAGPETDVSRWEPADDRASRRRRLYCASSWEEVWSIA